MEAEPSNPRLDPLQGELTDGLSVENGVVSTSQQDQAPRQEASSETVQAVGWQSTGLAGVETSTVGRELSIREKETASAVVHMTSLDRFIYTGMARRRLLSAARFATQSMLLRGEATLPKGANPLDRLDIRLPLQDWPEFTDEYAERDRIAGKF